ncbi:MAG: alpha-L-fucosidase [Planctomycetota bacterium]
MILRSLLLCLPLLAAPTAAQDAFLGREIARTMHWTGAEWLLRETRESEEGVELLLAQLGIEPGMTVCDLGVGVGVHALPIAERVGPEGRVLAVDIQQEMLDMLAERGKRAGIDNIVPVLGGEADPRVEPGSCDLILLVDVYHEFSKPAEMLAAMRAALKPGGRVALVEFRLEDPDVPIKRLHKMSRAQILKEWESHGFALVDQFDGLPWQHLMFFSRDDAPASAAPEPVGALPEPRQLAWHEREYYAFVHFNMNTFTDVEWGEGREPPSSFLPTELDCGQWADVARAAGMTGIILTAKHHDGFCLWDSAYTEHDVASSPWRDGGGDVLRELSEACAERGLGFGVYLSPWDRNCPVYGDSPRYNEYFKNQLTEVLTGYGPVFEVWFDGACGEGPNGKRQVYDWPGFVATVREHQPGAVIFSDAGPDVRWVGNERGYSNETAWATLNRDELAPGTPRYPELTSGHEDGTHWVPSECDVSIRPGWYYHPDQDDDVKTLRHLLDIWHGSVGRNSNLLLNLPVDRRGLVHENDAAALMALRGALDAIYDVDLAADAQAHASSVWAGDPQRSARAVLDGQAATYWAPAAGDGAPALTLELEEPRAFNRVRLSEHVARGQRVRAFAVDVRTDGAWRALAEATTIGVSRILVTDTVVADAVRVRVLDSKSVPLLAELALFLAPAEVTVTPEPGDFEERVEVRLASDAPRAEIRYTLDGSEPTAKAALYKGPLVFTEGTTLRAAAFYAGKRSLNPLQVRYERVGY